MDNVEESPDWQGIEVEIAARNKLQAEVERLDDHLCEQAEMRKQDEALIRQLRYALDECLDDSNTTMGKYAKIYTERYRPHVLCGFVGSVP